MTIQSSKFGIETELVGDKTSLRIPDVRQNEYKEFGKAKICWDDEYYDSQIEYKLFPTTIDDEEAFNDYKKFIIQQQVNGGRLNGRDWVGTHIHLFLEKDGVPFETMRERKIGITYFLYSLLTEFYLTKDNCTSIDLLDIERLSRSHNIFRYFDQEYLDNTMKSQLELCGFHYKNFNDGTDRKKYQPVIWSLPNSQGKPLTLELRLLTNQFFLALDYSSFKIIIQKVDEIMNMTQTVYKKVEQEYKRKFLLSHLFMSKSITTNTKRAYKKWKVKGIF